MFVHVFMCFMMLLRLVPVLSRSVPMCETVHACVEPFGSCVKLLVPMWSRLVPVLSRSVPMCETVHACVESFGSV